MTDHAAEVLQRCLETEGYIFKCKRCGKTPEDIGWCGWCGYNRDYEMILESHVRH